jgi:hypothetical protein
MVDQVEEEALLGDVTAHRQQPFNLCQLDLSADENSGVLLPYCV